MKIRAVAILAAWMATSVGTASAASAPAVAIAKLDALPIVISKPYDSSADADVTVDAAIARAKQTGKRVLIELGGNWCPDCIILTNIMRLPEVAPFISSHYEVVLVDVGRLNKNRQIPARYGITQRLEGVPAVLIVDANGKLLNAGNIVALDEAHNMEPQAIVNWLASWAG